MHLDALDGGLASLPADDDDLLALLRSGATLPLLAAAAQATGDLALLRDDLRPDPARVREPQGGLTGEQRRAANAEIARALRRLAGEPSTDGPRSRVDADGLHQILEFMTGEEVSGSYLDLLVEELDVEGDDPRRPSWLKDDLDPARDFRVLVIGAGMSGLLAAHRLRQAGVDVMVIEKNDEVGGTWLENRYPGCRVDVPNQLYSYSFAQRDWPQHFSTRDVLLDYFRDCADEFGLREHICCGTEVVSAVYREPSCDWVVTVRGPDGHQRDLRADVVVSAVGQLNRPNIPALAGAESFEGPTFHSAQWDPTVDLTGRRVAVIGTGASGFQLIPEIAEAAAHLSVFQRTPNWFLPAPEYREDLSEGTTWLLRNVPLYRQWYRFWLFWRLAEGALPAARVEPDWSGEHDTVSRGNDELRALLTMYLEHEFADRPDLLEHVVPHYPPLAKRMLLDDGTWARALKRDDVELIVEPIDHIEPHAVVTTDDKRREVDVLVYATGFEASRFLMPMRVAAEAGSTCTRRGTATPAPTSA